MLKRPEIGTIEDMLLFLDSQDPTEEYIWGDVRKCPAARYQDQRLGEVDWMKYGFSAKTPESRLACMAREFLTYGELTEACRKEWEKN